MNKLTLHNERIRIEKLIPSKWDELFLHQALSILKLSRKEECFSVRMSMLKVLLNLNFTNLRFSVFLRKTMQKDTWKLLVLTSWIFEGNTSLTKLLLKKVKTRFSKARHCQGFDKTQFWQWVHADTHFLNYLQQEQEREKEQSINKMMACFYLKTTFNAEIVDKDSVFFKKVSSEEKELFLLWYLGNREQLVINYEGIFQGNEETTKRKDFGWAGVLDDLSQDITKMEQVGELNIHYVLFSLNKQIIRNQEAEAEMKKNQKS